MKSHEQIAAKAREPYARLVQELVGALKSTANCLERLIEKHGEQFRPFVDSLEQARAAIAKAEGR